MQKPIPLISFSPRRGAAMPRKPRKKSSSLDVSIPPTRRRGRPRKIVAPEALLPFGKHKTTAVEKRESSEKKTKENQKSRRTNPATSERHYTLEEVEFMNALAEFKQASGRLFPTCSEILDVLRNLGYEKAKRQE